MTTVGTRKAIETQYAGTLFRSRLEARWAVVFDRLGIRWEYEPEAFDLGAGVGYLPDFWLPETQTWAEVKGSPGALAADDWKLAMACEGGSPLWGMSDSDGTTRGLLILGPIPRPDRPTDPWIVQHHKGVNVNVFEFDWMRTRDAHMSDATPLCCFGAFPGSLSEHLLHGLPWFGGEWRTVMVGQRRVPSSDPHRWQEALSAGRSARFDPASRRTRYGL